MHVHLLLTICVMIVTLPCGRMAAQFDDAAESAWAVPLIDAIDVFKNSPLCLRCVKPSQLTILPGIGARTASRIVSMVRGNPTASIEVLSDTLCLSIDQKIILSSCATLNCNCTSFLSSAQARTRVSNASSSPNSTSYGRVDVRTSAGRIGVITQQFADAEVLGGWLTSSIGKLSLAAGDFSARAGTGLVIGSAGGFGRSPLSVAMGAEADHTLRPWTSTWQDGMHRGIALKYSDTISGKPLSIMSIYSNINVAGRAESNISASAAVVFGNVTVGINVQRLKYSASVERSSMRIVNEAQRSLGSVCIATVFGVATGVIEVGTDDSLRPLATAVVRLPIPRGTLIWAARYMHPDVRNPYGTAISSLSGIGNEWGILSGVQWSERGGWRAEASVDVHGILSASYGRPLSSYGMNLTLDAERNLTKHAVFSCRVRYESDDEGYRLPNSSFTKMITMDRLTIRGEIASQLSPRLRVRGRIDLRRAWFTMYRASETGALAFADAHISEGILTIKSRVTIFSAQSATVAPYTIEQQTDGYMRTVMGSGQGSRFYISASVSLLPSLTLSASALRTIRFDKPPENSQSLIGVVQMDLRIK